MKMVKADDYARINSYIGVLPTAGDPFWVDLNRKAKSYLGRVQADDLIPMLGIEEEIGLEEV